MWAIANSKNSKISLDGIYKWFNYEYVKRKVSEDGKKEIMFLTVFTNDRYGDLHVASGYSKSVIKRWGSVLFQLV